VKTVGVGEATVPAMPILLRQAGVNERDFFKRCNASFKLGVWFDNWNVDRNGKPVAYINSFNEGRVVRGVESAYYYLKYGIGGGPFSDVVTAAVDLARACKGPHPLGAKSEEQNPGFAYHLDAGLFAELLRDICVARGIDHIRDDVVDVEKDERGHIAALQLKERGRQPVELVVDCTGFRGMLINKALGEPFVDYSKYLANDRAAAIQVPHPNPDKFEPLTRSTALSSGWVWRVPLYNRVGTGYVFISRPPRAGPPECVSTRRARPNTSAGRRGSRSSRSGTPLRAPVVVRQTTPPTRARWRRLDRPPDKPVLPP
jgi:tryptophan halogenase